MEDFSYLDVNLPEFLQNDKDKLIKGRLENSSVLDCLYYEVQGSINLALYGDELSENQANYLREKYL